MKRVLMRGGRVAAEDDDRLREADVLVEGGVIRRTGPGIPLEDGVEEIDCSGKILLPGLFDLHVHLREPGREDKETIRTGSEAAINGGITGIVAMPNTSPAIDSGGMVQAILDIAFREARIPVLTSGCITRGRAGQELAGIGGMVEKGAIMITDDGDPVENPQTLRRAMEYARGFGIPVACHCETKALSGDGAMNEGRVSYGLGVPGMPACSEEICMERDIRIAQMTGAHAHIQHVSSAAGLEIVRRFKEEGVRVTCEVTPHHLLFCDEDLGDYDTHYKMNPPLRSREDCARLLEGLREGCFDVIATDHAPHTDFEKSLDLASAPFGITGLETALVSLYHYFIRTNAFGWGLLVKRYSAEPRRLVGRAPAEIAEGRPCELVVFDPAAETAFTREFMRSKSSNTPFLDRTLSGRVEMVVVGDAVLLDRREERP